MDIAEVHHKIPASLRLDEDVLTSNVFGLLDFVRPQFCLLPWLGSARNLDGQLLGTGLGAYHVVLIAHWPRYQHVTEDRTEPDLVMSLLRADGTADLLVVEVKYRSGPSGWPTAANTPEDVSEIRGQLGRQWRIATGLPHGEAPGAPLDLGQRWLVYLTPETAMPRYVMEPMIKECNRAGLPGMRQGLYWLCWLDLAPLLGQILGTSELLPHERRALGRLAALLGERQLSSLSRIEPPGRVVRVPWSYGYPWAAPQVAPVPHHYTSEGNAR